MSLKRAESFSGIAFVPIVALMIWVVAVTVPRPVTRICPGRHTTSLNESPPRSG